MGRKYSGAALLAKAILKKLLLLRANVSYESKLKYLRNQGALIGDRTRLNCSVNAFGSEPYLIMVGEDCLFSSGVCFFTHDGGIKVLSDLGFFDGKRMDIVAPIKIGNNVYIGTGAYILPGVTIGDNCIIGASAVVTRNIPRNSVAVGVPAHVIRTIDEYYQNAMSKGYLHPTASLSPEEKKSYFMTFMNSEK